MDLSLVDGALLVDLWPDLDVPEPVRAAWQRLIDHARDGPVEDPIRVSYDQVRKWDAEERKERIAARKAEASWNPDRPKRLNH